MKVREILREMDWKHTSSAAKAMMKYPNAWIHFSKFPKLGINPSTKHHDPQAIYFYPIKWLSDVENRSSAQYATESPYYFICRIKTTDKSINLKTIQWHQIEQLSKTNGWIDDLYRVRNSPELIHADWNQIYKTNPRLLKRDGGLFWSIMDYLVFHENKSWLQMLKGVDVVIDPGLGIINQAEPAQAFVLDRTKITVIEAGNNKSTYTAAWGEAVRIAADKLGGHFFWKDKHACFDVSIDGKPITVRLFPGQMTVKIGHFREGMWVEITERLEHHSFTSPEVEARTISYLVKKAADKAGTTGVNVKWDKLFPELREKLGMKNVLKNYFHDGTLIFSNSYSDRPYIRFETSKDNELFVHISVEFSGDPIFEYEQAFPSDATVDDVVRSIRNGVANAIIKNAPVPDKMFEFFEKHTGIDLTMDVARSEFSG